MGEDHLFLGRHHLCMNFCSASSKIQLCIVGTKLDESNQPPNYPSTHHHPPTQKQLKRQWMEINQINCYQMFTTIVHNLFSQHLFATFVHNFYSQLLFTVFVQNYCSQLLFTTYQNCCSHLLFTIFFPQQSFKNDVNKFGFQFFFTDFLWFIFPFFTNFVHNFCSQLLFTNLFPNVNYCSQKLNSTVVHNNS